MKLNCTNLRQTRVLSLLIVGCFATAPSFAKNFVNNSSQNPTVTPREKIGLVLSGGGARGLAHLGVLKALEEQHVPIDFIAGTSAGALIGGMYASGMSVAEIEKEVNKLDLNAVVFSPPDRRKLPQNTRNLEYKGNIVADLSITKEGKLNLPNAVTSGAKVEEVLRDLLKEHPYNIDFDKLPIPFRAVAADLTTGKAVILRKGQLAQALRASMSIPAAFPPVELDGKLLVDGMIDRNMPVDVAKAMGATRIIAVDVGSDLLPKDQLNSVFGVSEQLLNLLVQRNMNEQIALLGKKDVYIRPKLGNIGNLEFQRGEEAAKAGWEAMQTPEIRAQLSKLAVPVSTYNALMSKHTPQTAPAVKIDFIRVQTNGLASPASLYSQIKMREGQNFDITTVNADIDRILNSGRIATVTYNIDKVGDLNELVYNIEERDVAKHVLRVGFEGSSNGLSNEQFLLHLSHRRIWLNNLGGEWRNNLTVGYTNSVDSQINQPLNNRGSMFIRPYLHAEYSKHPAYLSGSDEVAVQYNISRQKYGFLLGTPIARLGEWGIGLSYDRSHIMANHINPLLMINSQTQANGMIDAEITLDQLNDLNSPSKGYFFHGSARFAPIKSSNGQHLTQIHTFGIYAKSYKAHSLAFSAEAAGQNNNKNVYLSPYSLGGFQHLSGYAQNQFVGNYLAFASITYRYRTPWRVLNNPLILGASIETGNTWARAADISGKGLKYSSSLFGALRTPIGPAQIGLGFSDTGNIRAYLFLGRTFSGNN